MAETFYTIRQTFIATGEFADLLHDYSRLVDFAQGKREHLEEGD